MINKELFDSFSNKTKEELTDEPFSFRECTKCQDYFDLGGSHQAEARRSYVLSY
jgi:hypothetical protein